MRRARREPSTLALTPAAGVPSGAKDARHQPVAAAIQPADVAAALSAAIGSAGSQCLDQKAAQQQRLACSARSSCRTCYSSHPPPAGGLPPCAAATGLAPTPRVQSDTASESTRGRRGLLVGLSLVALCVVTFVLPLSVAPNSSTSNNRRRLLTHSSAIGTPLKQTSSTGPRMTRALSWAGTRHSRLLQALRSATHSAGAWTRPRSRCDARAQLRGPQLPPRQRARTRAAAGVCPAPLRWSAVARGGGRLGALGRLHVHQHRRSSRHSDGSASRRVPAPALPGGYAGHDRELLSRPARSGRDPVCQLHSKRTVPAPLARDPSCVDCAVLP